MSGGLTGWETMIGEDGEIYQAGIPSCPAEEHDDGLATLGWVTRALVLAVYYTDEDVRKDWTNDKQRAVLCDVRTIGRYSRSLFKVPVLQRAQGLWDEDLYIPRAAKLDINGGIFASGSAGVDGSAPTPAEQTDGDHVLVTFLENDPRQPVILPFTLGHPNSNTTPKKSDGRFRRIRHNGVVVEFDKDGNLTLDASQAAKPDLDSSGKEQSNSGTAGKIKIITKDGAGAVSRLELDQNGSVKLEAGGASEYLRLTKGSAADLVSSQAINVTAGDLIKESADRLLADLRTSATVLAPQITLGSPAFPVIKHPAWEADWAALLTELVTQMGIYNPAAIPPPQPTSADYYKILVLLQHIAGRYPILATTITKAG